MNIIAIIILIFSLLGAIDYILGNRFGIGAEFERAFSLFRPMALTMLGMIVIAPAIGAWLAPLFDAFYSVFGIDPSIIPASVLANDMGGASLALAVCRDSEIGGYNAFVVSSMMGCVISFTVPFSLGLVRKEQHAGLFFGLLCGVATVPIGSFFAGLMLGIGPLALICDLLPLILLAIIVSVALILVPKACVSCFSAFGIFMKGLSAVGLACAIFTFLTGIQISLYFDSLENAAIICVNACVTLSGALPLMFILTRLLKRQLKVAGSGIAIDEVSAIALLGSLVTNASTFGVMERMNKKGVVINSAFAVSASFALGGHLAFTMALDGRYVLPMIVGKIISGICAIILALLVYREENDSADRRV